MERCHDWAVPENDQLRRRMAVMVTDDPEVVSLVVSRSRQASWSAKKLRMHAALSSEPMILRDDPRMGASCTAER